MTLKLSLGGILSVVKVELTMEMNTAEAKLTAGLAVVVGVASMKMDAAAAAAATEAVAAAAATTTTTTTVAKAAVPEAAVTMTTV